MGKSRFMVWRSGPETRLCGQGGLSGFSLCHSRTAVAAVAVHRVCFFVLRNRHWCNRVPGGVTNLGIDCLPSALTLTLAVPSVTGNLIRYLKACE